MRMKRQNPQTSPRRGGRACLGVLPEILRRIALLQRGVLERLRCAQTHNCLGLNLDCLTGGGIDLDDHASRPRIKANAHLQEATVNLQHFGMGAQARDPAVQCGTWGGTVTRAENPDGETGADAGTNEKK